MKPHKIKGIYTVRASLADVVNSYQFTGADRNAELSAAADFMLLTTCDDIDRPLNTDISFKSDNVLNIKAARIITNGAAGLRPALNSSVAAVLTIIGRAINDVTGDALGGFTFGLDYFNEWQELNVKFFPEKVNDNYFLSVNHTYSKLYVDDYNVQDDYLGQTFTATLELLIDTAGVLDHAGDIV